MSVEGQKQALPQCKTNGRFTSVSRHNVGEITCAAGRPWPSCDGGACAGERAASGPQHAPDGRRMDGLGARDIRLRLAIGKPLERFLTLVGC
jgi:hypothetical protein